jgi:hypothetical protein
MVCRHARAIHQLLPARLGRCQRAGGHALQGRTVGLAGPQGDQEGDAFDTQIEEAIAQTRVVIVIWSEHSVKSHWVRAEAAYALGKRKLPISIDQSEPPLQFMQIQTIDFHYWDRTSNHHAFQQLAGALAKRLEACATDAQPRSVSHKLATSKCHRQLV